MEIPGLGRMRKSGLLELLFQAIDEGKWSPYLFHGTSTDAMRKIVDEGLRPFIDYPKSWPEEFRYSWMNKPYVYTSPNLATSLEYAIQAAKNTSSEPAMLRARSKVLLPRARNQHLRWALERIDDPVYGPWGGMGEVTDALGHEMLIGGGRVSPEQLQARIRTRGGGTRWVDLRRALKGGGKGLYALIAAALLSGMLSKKEEAA